jgi:hypothetical protein
MIRQSHVCNLKEALAVVGLLWVRIIWYISAIPTGRKDIDNSIEHTIYIQINLWIPFNLLNLVDKP